MGRQSVRQITRFNDVEARLRPSRGIHTKTNTDEKRVLIECLAGGLSAVEKPIANSKK
jgi:hypothetical protein